MSIRKIKLPLFRKGSEVTYNGWPYRIEYNHVKGFNLLVKLEGLDELIDTDQLQISPTVFELKVKDCHK